MQFDFKQMSIYEIYHLSRLGYLELCPSYQRSYKWTTKQKENLIGAVFKGYPIQQIILEEMKAGFFRVIDGVQRLTAIVDFINGQFQIIGREGELCRFQDLTALERRKLEDYQILVYIMRGEGESAAGDIFLSINQGGRKLSWQDTRSLKYWDQGMPFVKKLARLMEFESIVHNKNEGKRQELALRFLAFYLRGYGRYDGKMNRFLDQILENYGEYMGKEEQTEHRFKQMCRAVQTVWPVDAFVVSANGGKRKRFSNGLFDIISYSFTQYPEKELIAKSEEINQALCMLLKKDVRFKEAVTGMGSTGKQKVVERFTIWMNKMQEIVGG